MNVKLRRFKSILSILLTVVMTAVFVLPSALAEEFTATANGWIYADADGGTANKVIVKFNRLIVFDETAWVDNITVNHADDTPGNFGTEAEACVNEDQQTIVITLGADNDIVIGDQITFAGTTVQDANQTEAFAGTVELGGSFEKAAVDFAVLPEDAVITVEGYEAPYELAIGAYTYTAEAENYEKLEGVFEVTEEDITNGAKTVEVSLEMKEADYTALQNAVDEAKTIDPESCTPSSYAALSEAVAKGEKALSEEKVKIDRQSEIDALVQNIQDAAGAVVKCKEVKFAAVATAADAKKNYAKADKIVMVFSEPLESGADILSGLSIKDSVESAAWADAENTVYELTLKKDAELINGQEIAYTMNENVKTAFEGYVVKDYAAIVSGNLEGASEYVTAGDMAATIVKMSGKPGVNDGDKIVLVFNAPTEGEEPVITVLTDAGVELEAAAVEDTNFTVYEIVLTAEDGITNAAKLSYKNMKDVPLNGSFGSAGAPKVLEAYAIDNDGSELTAGDSIVIVFDRPTNGTDITPEKLAGCTVTGKPNANLGNNSTAVWEEDFTRLVITVGDTAAVYNGITIDIGSLEIKDRYGIEDAADTVVEVKGSFGYTIEPRITKAVAFTQNGMDIIRIFFNVGVVEGDIMDVTVSGFTTKAEPVLKKANGVTYVELVMDKEEHGAFVSGKHTVSVSGLVDEETMSKKVSDTPVNITGAFVAPVTPEIMSLTAVSKDGSGKAKAGDKIVCVFNTDVKIGSVDVSEGSFGTEYTVDYAEGLKNAVEITLGGKDIDVKPGRTHVSFEGFVDYETESEELKTTTAAVTGSFGYSVEPEILSVTAVSDTGSGTAKTGDKVVVVFNTKMSGVESDIFGEGTSDDGYVWTFEIAEDDSVKIGDMISFTAVCESTGESSEMQKALSGSFGYVEDVKLLSLTAVSCDGDDLSKSNDRIVLVFNYKMSGVTGALGSAESADGYVWTYTLDENSDMKIGQSMEFEAVSAKTGDTTAVKAVLEGSFGYSEELKIVNVTLISAKGNGVVEEGDKLVLVFSGSGADRINAVNSEFGSFENISEYVWSMTVGANSNITVGNGITVQCITDEDEKLTFTPNVGGSAGYLITPELISATALSQDGSGVAKSGDKIILVFNTDISKVDLTSNTTGLGTGANCAVSDTSKSVWEITLGEGTMIKLGSTIEANIYAEKTNAANTVSVKLGGTFGYAASPKLLSATAVSKNGSGVAKTGDTIYLVFNTKVNLTAEGDTAKLGKLEQVGEGYVWTITLEDRPDKPDEPLVEIGAKLTFKAVSYINGEEAKIECVLGGSFGGINEPRVLSTVLSMDKENAAEIITVAFDRAVYMDEIPLNQLSTVLRENNAHLGTGVTAEWIDDYTLVITLGKDAQTNSASTLNLAKAGIKAADTNLPVSGLEALEIEGSLIPVVEKVNASGETITIIFSARTNKFADISQFSTLFGAGAKTSWDETGTVLTITLGENYSVTNDGYVVLNGMGIADAFSGTHKLVGQYKIEGDIAGDKVTVKRAAAQSYDKSVTTAQCGDKIVFVFSNATNADGAELNTPIPADKITFIETENGNEQTFGSGFTGVWTNYSTFVLSLGGAQPEAEPVQEGTEPTENASEAVVFEPSIAVGDKVTVKDIAFANGSGTMDDTEIEITGSFNGREFVVTEGKITSTSEKGGDYKVEATVENTLLANNVGPTVVCVAYNGSKVVSITRLNVKIEDKVTAVFEISGKEKVTSAKIYVCDHLFGDINESTALLAEVYTVSNE